MEFVHTALAGAEGFAHTNAEPEMQNEVGAKGRFRGYCMYEIPHLCRNITN